MFVILAFIVVGNVATSASLSGVNLDCTNDYDKMSCHFDAPNCTNYNVTLLSPNGLGESYCLPLQCKSGQCCCSIHVILVLENIHTAIVRRRGEYVESKNISVTLSLKPRTPSMVSVNETNGNIKILWKTKEYMDFIQIDLQTRLKYRKKGDSEWVTDVFNASSLEQQCDSCFSTEILGKHLESSTTYLFAVQSFLSWSNPPSEWSEEYEFTTSVSREILLRVLFITLCLLAITITSVTYISYVKCRAKYWDSFGNYKNSQILKMHPSKEEVLKPIPPIISSIYVETLIPDDTKLWSKDTVMDSTESLLQRSGTSTGPSSLNYAHTEAVDIIAGVQGALSKAFMNIVPVSATTNQLVKGSSRPTGDLSTCEQNSGLENTITYAFIRPSATLKSNTQPEMQCDSGYQGTGTASTDDKNRGTACEENMSPILVSSYMLNSTFHQQTGQDSGRLSNVSLSCSNTNLSGDVENSVGTRHKNCQKIFNEACFGGEDATKDGDRCVPATLQGTIPSDDNYQAFQRSGEFSDIKFKEQKSGNTQKTEDASCVPAVSDVCLPVADSYETFKGSTALYNRQFLEENDNKEWVKDSLKDDSQGDTCVPMKQPKHCKEQNMGQHVGNPNSVDVKLRGSLPMDNNYQSFQKLNEFSVDQLEKRENQYQDKVLEDSLKNTSQVDSCIPVSSKHVFLVDDNYQAFPCMLKNACNQLEEQNRHKKEDEVSENSLEKVTKGSKSTFHVAHGYEAFHNLKGLADGPFGEQNSGKKDLEKIVLKDAIKNDIPVPGHSNPSFCVDDQYRAFHSFQKQCDNQVVHPKSGEKQSLGTDPLEDATVDDKVNSCDHLKLQDSPLTDENYQVFRGLKEPSVTHIEENKSGQDNHAIVFENSPKDSTKDYSCVHKCIINNSYQVFHGSCKQSVYLLETQNSDKKAVERGIQNISNASKSHACAPVAINRSFPVVEGYEALQGLSKISDSQNGEEKK
ncbi:uncharacterized protein LOC144091512 [Stigmatopora argus]